MASAGRRGPSAVDQPIETTRGIRPSYDSERFGRISERVARFIGSWAFIAWMTVVILMWVSFNVFAPGNPAGCYPFIFLTLLLSVQRPTGTDSSGPEPANRSRSCPVSRGSSAQ